MHALLKPKIMSVWKGMACPRSLDASLAGSTVIIVSICRTFSREKLFKQTLLDGLETGRVVWDLLFLYGALSAEFDIFDFVCACQNLFQW